MRISFLFLFLVQSAWAADPIVFAHGLGVEAGLYEKLVPMKKFFKKHGYELHIANTPAFGVLEERAEILNTEIERLVPEGSFHLLGHSMGGLDSRLAIQNYGLGDRVLSLTTLATPHRGSAMADWVIRILECECGKAKTMRALLKLLSFEEATVRQLSSSHMQQFNQEVLDDPRVRYYSMGFYIDKPLVFRVFLPYLWWSHARMVKEGYPQNDGLVAVESAYWGRSLGNFPGDHGAQTTPLPYGFKMIYDDVFQRVIHNLNLVFE